MRHLLGKCNNSLKCRCLIVRQLASDVATNPINARPFNEIPGPKSLPVIGTLWKYLPLIGEYSFDRLHHNGFKKLKKFGPVVREEIVPGENVIWIFNPDDIEKVFRNEGRYPERRSHLALQKYRLDRPEIYNTGGLLPTNGPEWWRLRSEFQHGLSRPKNVRSYLPQTDEIILEFINHVKRWPVSADQKDFSSELSRLFLELTGIVAFDIRLESLRESERTPNSRSSQLINAAFQTNSCILGTDNGPQLWRRLETRLYKKLRKSQQCIEQIAVDLLKKKLEKVSNSETDDDTKSLLEQYLLSENLDVKDVTGMAVDMLLAGIDTTTYTSSFALYHLGTNKDKQRKLYEESCKLLPEPNSPITTAVLSQAQYTKAVVKENFRMNPISVGIGRILVQDAVFSGYHIPKGTVVVTQNQVTCRMEKYFPHPNEFIPERWIKDSIYHKQTSPYLLLPFGHGPRTCIARWFAEQNLHTLLLRLCRHCEIGWTGGVLDCKSLLINKPDQPVTITLKPH
ncbi:hypothetical protein L9F63_008449 [Diploptera punctata]|uniref:Cytochrome P450 302a1, mitochondrial n=1 Tax=Diploptera punctata TaxID=6984 RepID=A0AAD7Z647_DIPPU|nr:hypothetical protein L9F63_008449 [Diploptera punctata]